MDEKKIAELQKKVLFYETILDSIRNGVMITDRRGKVIFFSKAYGEFLGIKPEEILGKHCTEVIENTRMHIVAETGVPEINDAQSIRGQEMVVQRIPIRIDGQGLFVFGQVMFKDVRDVHTLSSRLSLLESKVEFYERELTDLRSSKYTLQHIVGNSKGITELKQLALRAAEIDAPVLITGESGTGKELFAHAIHYASKRRLYPFIRLNCSAIPKELLEAELFGYEPGAFTGASNKGKAGKFELAHGGSIFLDEIGDLPMEMQPKLLRILEEKEFEHLGGNHLIKSNFRLIAATHENLEDLVARGKFRKDLFYRLNVIPISILPLRERMEDLPLIAESPHEEAQPRTRNQNGQLLPRRDADFSILSLARQCPGTLQHPGADPLYAGRRPDAGAASAPLHAGPGPGIVETGQHPAQKAPGRHGEGDPAAHHPHLQLQQKPGGPPVGNPPHIPLQENEKTEYFLKTGLKYPFFYM